MTEDKPAPHELDEHGGFDFAPNVSNTVALGRDDAVVLGRIRQQLNERESVIRHCLGLVT